MEDYLRLQWLEDKLEEYLRKAADSGAFDGKPGDNGVTFTPSVSENGDLSWRNNGGLPNPQTVNIRGPHGDSTAATAAANAAKTSAANAETHAADAATSAAAAQAAADAMGAELSHIKEDLSNKLPKSPADWESWTAEEQAAAREQVGAIGKMRLIATVDVAESSNFIFVAKDADGKSIDLREIVIIGIAPTSTNGDATNGYVSIGSDGFTGYNGMFGAINIKSTAYETCWMCHIVANPNVPAYSEIASAVRPITAALINKQVSFGNAVRYFNNINKIAIYPNGTIEVGTKIFVLGVDRI